MPYADDPPAGEESSDQRRDGLTTLEAYRLHIEYIRHENDLIHQRAARFIGVQAAMIAVIGLVMQKYTETMLGQTNLIFSKAALPIYLFVVLLSVVGFISCFSALNSLRAARDAQLRLEKHFRKRFGKAAKAAGLPALMGGGSPTASDHGPRFLLWLPIVLSVFWVIVFLVAVGVIVVGLWPRDPC